MIHSLSSALMTGLLCSVPWVQARVVWKYWTYGCNLPVPPVQNKKSIKYTSTPYWKKVFQGAPLLLLCLHKSMMDKSDYELIIGVCTDGTPWRQAVYTLPILYGHFLCTWASTLSWVHIIMLVQHTHKRVVVWIFPHKCTRTENVFTYIGHFCSAHSPGIQSVHSIFQIIIIFSHPGQKLVLK